jgi:hypothetical protein
MRKPKPFSSATQLSALIDSYFLSLEAKPKRTRSKILGNEPPTFAGLLLFTGFDSGEEFEAYKAIPKYARELSRAKLRIQDTYEKRLLSGSSTGATFALRYVLGLNERPAVKETENKKGDNVLQVEIVPSDIKPASSESEVIL